MVKHRILSVLSAALLVGFSFLQVGCGGDTAQPETPGAGTTEAGPAGAFPIENVGLQLYTLRSLMQEDFEGTLAQVADAGYKEVEFAGLYGRSPEAVRRTIDSLGLTGVAAHVGIERVRDSLDAVIREAKALGLKYIVVPSLPQDMRSSLDGYRQVAQVLNQAGERARQEGLALGYHNHRFEFEPIEGQLPYDILLQETDPENVKMELDLGWATAAGQDPVALFQQHPGRFVMSHVKDVDAQGELVPLGEGVVDFEQIFSQAEQAGMEHFFVEHDRPGDDPLQTVRSAYTYLKGQNAQDAIARQ